MKRRDFLKPRAAPAKALARASADSRYSLFINGQRIGFASRLELDWSAPGRHSFTVSGKGVVMPIVARPPLHKEIAEALSERIVSRELGPNALLPPERELCESFGVSRTVIREAIKLLESRGLVRIERGRGTVVQEARHEVVTDSLRLMLRRSPHTIEELLELRKILEAGIAALAAERRTDENLAAMRQFLETMRQKPGEPEGYVDADLGFHAEIARAAQNPVLLLVLNPLAELLRQSRIATFSGPRFVKLRTKQHEAIFEMVSKKDPEGARAMMLWHLSDTQKDLERHGKKS